MMEREAGYRIIDERYFDRAKNVAKLEFTQKSTIQHKYIYFVIIMELKGVLSQERGKVHEKCLKVFSLKVVISNHSSRANLLNLFSFSLTTLRKAGVSTGGNL